MNEPIDDLLSRRRDAEQPFRVPEGYFDALEDRVMARIATEKAPETVRRRVWTVIKPALALAATFALIFGMGYGVLSLTQTLKRGNGTPEAPGYATTVEEWITPASLINYYEMDAQPVEEEIDEETLVNYLASELSFTQLAEIYAQANLK